MTGLAEAAGPTTKPAPERTAVEIVPVEGAYFKAWSRDVEAIGGGLSGEGTNYNVGFGALDQKTGTYSFALAIRNNPYLRRQRKQRLLLDCRQTQDRLRVL